jgi:hypothetical protein
VRGNGVREGDGQFTHCRRIQRRIGTFREPSDAKARFMDCLYPIACHIGELSECGHSGLVIFIGNSSRIGGPFETLLAFSDVRSLIRGIDVSHVPLLNWTLRRYIKKASL